MEEKENFQKQEISGEIIEEWYKEKGFSVEEKESIERQEKKEGKEVQEKKEAIQEKTEESPSQASYGVYYDDKKKMEEEKKLSVKKEVKHLIAIAEEKGLEYSIREAQKKNDPFLLDIYHDVLAKDASYRRFLSR